MSNEIDWTEAICTQTDPEIFFPETGDSVSADSAKRVCASCVLVVPCLTGAIERKEEFGIWGGANYHTRRKIAKGQKTVQIHLEELAQYKKG